MEPLLRNRRHGASDRSLPGLQRRDGRIARQPRHHRGRDVQHARSRHFRQRCPSRSEESSHVQGRPEAAAAGVPRSPPREKPRLVVVLSQSHHFPRRGCWGLCGLYSVQGIEERIEILKKKKKIFFLRKLNRFSLHKSSISSWTVIDI